MHLVWLNYPFTTVNLGSGVVAQPVSLTFAMSTFYISASSSPRCSKLPVQFPANVVEKTVGDSSSHWALASQGLGAPGISLGQAQLCGQFGE